MGLSPEQIAAVFVGLGAIITAVGVVLVKLATIHKAVNSNLDALNKRLDTSLKEGEAWREEVRNLKDFMSKFDLVPRANPVPPVLVIEKRE